MILKSVISPGRATVFKKVKNLCQGSTFCIYRAINWQQRGTRAYARSTKNYRRCRAETGTQRWLQYSSMPPTLPSPDHCLSLHPQGITTQETSSFVPFYLLAWMSHSWTWGTLSSNWGLISSVSCWTCRAWGLTYGLSMTLIFLSRMLL